MGTKRCNKKLYQITINVDTNSRLIGINYRELQGEYSLSVRKMTPKEDLFKKESIMTPLYQKIRRRDTIKVSDLIEIKGQNKVLKRFLKDYSLEDEGLVD